MTYDALGRVATAANPLGTFTHSYIGQTGRTNTVTRSGGNFTVDYDYYPNTQDQRLSRIRNLGASSAVLSQFDYEYNAIGEILKWTQAGSGGSYYDLKYDRSGWLTAAHLRDEATGAMLEPMTYGYDDAGNRLRKQEGNAATTWTANTLNQLGTLSAGGPVTIEGRVTNEPATVTVNGQSVPVDSNNRFQATITGSYTGIPVTATDGSGNTTNKTLDLAIAAQPSVTLNYDLNGNMTSHAPETYEWDAANRLVAVNYPGTNNRTEFTYDAQGRRTKIVEKTNNTVTSTKNFVWIGNRIAEERNAGNTVTRRFFSQGEQVGGQTYFYGKDHLGSIRDMVDANGVVQTSYDYSPWGERSYAIHDPAPVSGSKSMKLGLQAGIHQDHFTDATVKYDIGTGDKLVCWVWLDPKNPPREVMVQWCSWLGWEHRAYWGENLIPWGTDGTNTRRYAGPLPVAGGWVRLEMSAAQLGLEGQQLNGIAFTLYDGRAWWDAPGKRANGASSDSVWFDDALPAGAIAYGGWNWISQSVEASFAFTGHYFHDRSVLHLAKYRAYMADLGRWLSRDPLRNAELVEGPDLYLYARNSPIAYKDPLGLQAVFICTNGDRKVAKTPQELIQIAKGLSPGSLRSLLFQGHGSNTQQNLTPLDNTSLGGLKSSGGNVNVVDDSENVLADLGDLLADKFAPWKYGEQPSIIRLQGCSTGSSNSNLTRSVSLEVPSVLVLGSIGPSIGLPGLGGGFPFASQGEGIYQGGNNYNP